MEEGKGGCNINMWIFLSCDERFVRYSDYPPGMKKKGEKINFQRACRK